MVYRWVWHINKHTSRKDMFIVDPVFVSGSCVGVGFFHRDICRYWQSFLVKVTALDDGVFQVLFCCSLIRSKESMLPSPSLRGLSGIHPIYPHNVFNRSKWQINTTSSFSSGCQRGPRINKPWWSKEVCVVSLLIGCVLRPYFVDDREQAGTIIEDSQFVSTLIGRIDKDW